VLVVEIRVFHADGKADDRGETYAGLCVFRLHVHGHLGHGQNHDLGLYHRQSQSVG
jgi:hypothetical protein